jgi:outer membrane protein assembly factor BamB
MCPFGPLTSDQRLELIDALEEAEGIVSRLWSFEAGQKIRALAVDHASQGVNASVLVGSEDGYAYLLDATGELIWSFRGEGWVLGAGFARFEDGGERLSVVGGEGIHIVDGEGTAIDHCPCDSPITSLCVAPIDGTAAVLSGHQDGSLQAYSPDRGVFWRGRCPKRVVSLQCCDVDLDGEPEVVAASEDKAVYVLGADGEVRDRFQSTHWIISLAVGDVYGDGTPRVVIAGFDGDVHVYGGGKAAALRVRRRGILGLEIGRLLPNSSTEQFVVGSSDQQVAIFDPAGRELWRFRTGYGHRVVRILPSEPTPSLIVGAEDGVVHCVGLELRPGLRQRIVELARSLPSESLSPATMSARSAAILEDVVESQRSRQRSAIEKARAQLSEESRQLAARELVGVWHSCAEEAWSFATEGRIYDIAAPSLSGGGPGLALIGSGDGHAYALDVSDGSEAWSFKTGGPVRGATWIGDGSTGALVGSEDGCVYRLDAAGTPLWHIGTRDWILKVEAAPRPSDEVFAWLGSEGSHVEGFDERGAPLWRLATDARVRALACGDVDGDGDLELVAGSDDRHVYVVDASTGQVKTRFEVPHWVLVAKASDIDGDGRAELLIGTEDGNVYVYSHRGDLLWSFATNHWVAAIDTQEEGFTEGLVVVGSADGSVYGLNRRGELFWRWDTDARVRTIACCGCDPTGSPLIAFGSYDETVTMLRVPQQDELRAVATAICEDGNGISSQDGGSTVRTLSGLLDLAAPAARIVAGGRVAAASAEVNALAAALLICEEGEAGSPEVCQEVAEFLARTASELDLLAVLRTAAAAEVNEDNLKAIVAAMSELDADATIRARCERLSGFLV